MRIKKKNTRGNAKNFITRAQAVRKLQLSLADFRRLCIFKGIYPREPRNKKKANKGSTAPTTFYYTKDIQYLMHEPVLDKFREHKTFAKKLTKALGRGDVASAKKFDDNKPSYKLDNIIKERYPSFTDAVRDLDDALNMLFLFANLPATDQVNAKITADATKLCNQWLAYLARERLVRKVFVSIKGVYYQANVRGQDVRFLIPYKFPENIPSDIDFKIMLTFLEFYSTLLHFVLYKLYTESGLTYPPKFDAVSAKAVSGISSYVLEGRDTVAAETSTAEAVEIDAGVVARAVEDDKANVDDEAVEEDHEDVAEVELDTFQDTNKNAGDVLAQPSKYASAQANLFAPFTFFISREVPLDILEFLILSCGGKVISEVALDALETKVDLSSVTHQIVDRPVLRERVAGRTYAQPQWVFDCINKGELISVGAYAPGETLPPHLSPWGDAGGYNPDAEVEVEDDDDEEEEVDEEEVDEDIPDEEEQLELNAQKELELEAKGIAYTEAKDTLPVVKKRKAAEDDEKELKLIMMTNKQRKLYKKMKYSNDKKEERVETLKKKKKEITKGKK